MVDSAAELVKDVDIIWLLLLHGSTGPCYFSPVPSVIPDRAVHMAAKALSFSLFMMLKQGHSSRIIRAPPMKSRVRYRLSATMHNHRTPGTPSEESRREGAREGGRNELCCLIIP